MLTDLTNKVGDIKEQIKNDVNSKIDILIKSKDKQTQRIELIATETERANLETRAEFDRTTLRLTNAIALLDGKTSKLVQ